MRGRNLAIAAAVGTCFSLSAAMAGPNPSIKIRPSAGSPDGPVTVALSNNVVGDRSLVVNPDAFGGVTTGFGLAGNDDPFDPPGAEPLIPGPTFGTALFLYNPTTLDRVSLAHATSSMATTYPGTFITAITSPLVASDSDGDLVNDTANSAFTVTGGTAAVNLSVTLKQRVSKPAQGTSRFRQIWTITNNAAAPAALKINKHNDMDILASVLGPVSFEDVAGSFDAPGCQGITPYEREPFPEPPTSGIAFTLASNTPGSVYYAGRSGYDPDGAGPDPAFAFGTDFQIWNAYGLPPSWENHTAGIGTLVAGELPDQFPPLGVAPFDGFQGLQWSVTIPAGGSQVINVSTLYGSRQGWACYPDANCSGSLTVADFIAFQAAFTAASAYADCNGSNSLTIADFICYQASFTAGCN